MTVGDEKLLKLYDDMSAVYDQARVKPYFNNTMRLISEYLRPDSAVLEIGCGTGMYGIGLAQKGYTVKGFDYSEKMVDKSRANAGREGVTIDYCVADAEKKLPYGEEFNYALCLAVWECLPNPVAVLRNVHAVLKPGGRLLIITSNPFMAPPIILAEKLRIKKLRPAYVYFNSFTGRVKKWARETGFIFEKRSYSYYFIDVVFHLRKGK